MTIMEMLGQSGVLTVLGMGIVFGFLVTLVISVTIMGKVVQVLGARKGAAEPGQAPAPAPVKSAGAPLAVIAAAINEYQQSN